MPTYTLVEKPDQIAPRLRETSRVGVDTEFMRERTYFSQLCLVQIAAGEVHYCVDPLADQPMQEFWPALCDQTWVAHSARQDIEVIYQTAELMPAALFDTQVAAGLLGYQPQMGYANLVQELFDVELPKTHTRANWAARPLPATYLDYAAEDVEYLLPAYELLAEKLDKLGRLEWAESDSNLLLDPALYAIDPKTAIDRLKGARRLRGRRRVVAERLSEWREN
ncbi:MAG: ribonuclease D, partial [Gammaproteobacteria bacterium]|nr:ribonuclease D [Gammaproteobacteria bacterium]